VLGRLARAGPDDRLAGVVDLLGDPVALLEADPRQHPGKGLGDVVDSWVNRGTNKSVAPDQVSAALGRDVVDQLSLRTGLSRDQVVAELARMLPNVVDKLTPDGRLPTKQEIMQLIS